MGEIIGSIGEDGLLRIWQEDVLEAPLSGRRFKRIYQQPSATRVPYMSLDFKNIGTETYLAMISRDGQLTVCEPVDHDNLNGRFYGKTTYVRHHRGQKRLVSD